MTTDHQSASPRVGILVSGTEDSTINPAMPPMIITPPANTMISANLLPSKIEVALKNRWIILNSLACRTRSYHQSGFDKSQHERRQLIPVL
jgi:hypothetical protein